MTPIAGLAEITGPYQTAPFVAFDPAIVGAFEARCRNEPTEPGLPPMIGRNHALGLADARGGGHVILMFKGPDEDTSTCVGTVDAAGAFTLEGGGGGAPGGGGRGGEPIESVGPLEVLPGYGITDGSSSWGATSGRAGSEVAAIMIELRDGTRIDASLTNGLYAASWLTADWDDVHVLVYDGEGNLVTDQPL